MTASNAKLHQALHGSRLRSAAYDENTRVLEVVFHDLRTLSYSGVPGEVARRLFAAPNPASFWEERIAEEYPARSGRMMAQANCETRSRLDDLFGGSSRD